MLDINFIRENPDLVQKACDEKNFPVQVSKIIELDSQCRAQQSEWESLQSRRKALSKAMGTATEAERAKVRDEVLSLKSRMDGIEAALEKAKIELQDLLMLVPQPACSDVPKGKSDADNVEIKKWGTPRAKTETPLDHQTIGEKLGILDTERGVKIAGSRSYILRAEGSMLEQALIRFALDKVTQAGYTPYSIPVLVKESAMEGTGYFPVGRDQAYYVEKDRMALVGTSEVALCSLHADEILTEEELPKRLTAQSACFRREAGTYGKDTKGLYRVHQFQKVEMVILGRADKEESQRLHKELLELSESIVQDLELPYRVVYVCTGDLGQGQVRKHDIEVWMPSRDNYGETHSCSSFYDFQARRLGIRYRNKAENKNQFVYTLNNTALATPRMILALLENGQTPDGNVRIPAKLRPYLGGREFLIQR